MAAITQDTIAEFQKENQKYVPAEGIPVASGENLYLGGLFGISAGGEAIEIDTNRPVGGLALRFVDADRTVVLPVVNIIVWLDCANPTQLLVGRVAYALDNHTVTTSANNATCGVIRDWRTGQVAVELTLTAA